MLLTWVPLLYRTVYKLVYERHSRAKEAMRIMGMGDFAYWLSWFIHYSVVNAVLSLAVWSLMLINLVSLDSSPFMLLIVWLYGQSLFGMVMLTQSFFE